MRKPLQMLFALIALVAIAYVIGVAGSIDLDRIALGEAIKKMLCPLVVFATACFCAYKLDR